MVRPLKKKHFFYVCLPLFILLQNLSGCMFIREVIKVYGTCSLSGRAGEGWGPGVGIPWKTFVYYPPPPKLHFHWKVFAINRKNANILGMCISLIFHNEKSIFCLHAQKLKECLKVYQISKIIILLNGKDKTGRRNGNYFFVSFFSNNFNISLKHLEKF